MRLRKLMSNVPIFRSCLHFTSCFILSAGLGLAITSEIRLRANTTLASGPDYSWGLTARLQEPVLATMSFFRNYAGHAIPVGSALHEEPACFDELGRHYGLEIAALDRLRRSSLFLLVEYENGELQQGSGTVIRGQVGLARVLTAAHVVPPAVEDTDGPSPLKRIVAFDGEGRRVAELGIAFSGAPDYGIDHGQFRASADMAVLNVVSFAAGEDRSNWNQRALPLARQQSTRFSLLYQDPGTAVVNSGMSGGAMLTPDLEVSGVVIQTMMRSEDTAAGPKSHFSTAMLEAGNLEEDLKSLMETRLTDPGKVGAGLTLALPVAHGEVIEALGLNAGDITHRASDTSRRIIVGYPASDCRATMVKALEPGLLGIPPLDADWVLDAEAELMLALAADRNR
jgi:S1-C subfamily serine protease